LRCGKMRSMLKISIICLMLFVCALVATSVSADDELSMQSDASILSDQQASLYQGQTSQVYQINLNCPGTAIVTSSYGARFDIYAKKNWGYGSCPSPDSMMYNYDKVAYGYSGTASMSLDPGVWCIMVYCYSGDGSYSLRVSSTCPGPIPRPTPYPTVIPTPYPPYPPTPCGVYKSDSETGFLRQGQAAVYGYYIPTDGRSKIEWSMSSTGSCGGNTPIIAASANDVSVDSSSCSGSSTFDLYVFKDCNPKNSYCNTRYYSYGPNSYVSITPPASGSTYYVMVYARSGSGNYNLKMNSYKCSNTPIIVASTADAGTTLNAASAGTEDTGSGSEVSAPTADFVISGGSQ